MINHLPAQLILENGRVFRGYSFGAARPVAGEVVFNTAMTGYPESLTDPSYKGQILVSTYPLIGNYGVPGTLMEHGLAAHYESDKLQISGLVISDYSSKYSHWNAEKSLSEWMVQQQVPGIFGVDTRALTRLIRDQGALLGKIITGDDVEFYDPNKENLVRQVSTDHVQVYGTGAYRIVLLDCGTKNNIIRCLLRRNTTVIRVPWNHPFQAEPCDGVLLSNGPGDPAMCTDTIHYTRQLLHQEIPVFGICLGSQIMALASGASTFKLKYGHRSHNQPVRMQDSNRCFITSQNHGYAIDMTTLSGDWRVSFINLNDNTCEGIAHRNRPYFGVQFHPEASAGPVDTEFLFDHFMEMVRSFKKTGEA